MHGRDDVDHQPVGLERLGQRGDRLVEPEHVGEQDAEHEADDDRAEPRQPPAPGGREEERDDDERAGQRELVHVAPRHPVGVRGQATAEQRDEVGERADADQQDAEAAGHLGAVGGRPRRTVGRVVDDASPPPPTATACADRDVAQRGPLDGVGQEREEVDHPGRGHALVAQGLPLCVGHDPSSSGSVFSVLPRSHPARRARSPGRRPRSGRAGPPRPVCSRRPDAARAPRAGAVGRTASRAGRAARPRRRRGR